MKTTILALALIGIAGTAAAQSTIRLSDVPPGAIHTPGIGPGYIYPAYSADVAATGEDAMPVTSMMPGRMSMPSEQISVTTTGEARALSILRQQGFTNVQGLREAPDGSYHGLVMQRGGMTTVTVDRDGAVSIRQ
jgi:hypothetical protein